ncbi:hypothetical protein ANO11243_056210 [Dothideomycetidae sp. 11243]|nr:hypothetical protein ANO11243_056210 [fungal sp. No.11243]
MPPTRRTVMAFQKTQLYLDAARIVASIAVVGIAIYTVINMDFAGAYCGVVTAIITKAVSFWRLTVVLRNAAKLYNHWASLSLEIILVLLWLTSFGLWTHDAVLTFTDVIVDCSYYYGDCEYFDFSTGFQATQAIAAALSAVILYVFPFDDLFQKAKDADLSSALSVTILVLASIGLHRRRMKNVQAPAYVMDQVNHDAVQQATHTRQPNHDDIPPQRQGTFEMANEAPKSITTTNASSYQGY